VCGTAYTYVKDQTTEFSITCPTALSEFTNPAFGHAVALHGRE
jgi:hypothetical protein